jgi:hypothetical protein
MISSADILNSLQHAVNRFSKVAVIWHVVFYICIVVLISGWDPSNRFFIMLLSLPLLSVALIAWLSGNFFNGLVFTLVTGLFIFSGSKVQGNLTSSTALFIIEGALMILFGLAYPHFINGKLIKYFYASPSGILPCPTLSILIGFAFIYNGIGSDVVTITLMILGIFYGLFGMLKLAVQADLVLFIGSLTLLTKFMVKS